jgi:hypothetical protein
MGLRACTHFSPVIRVTYRLRIRSGPRVSLLVVIRITYNLILPDHQSPTSTYMATCAGDCPNFLAIDAKLYKVASGGYDPNTKQWAAD